MLALQHGLHLGVLGLQQAGAGALLGPVGEVEVVVVGQDRLGGHLLHAVVGHHGLAVLGGEVVFDVALAAGQRRGLDGIGVARERLGHVAVGDHDLAAVAVVGPVASVAAHVLCHLRHDLVKGHRVDGHALLLDHLVHVGRLAGQAVGLRMRALGLGDVLQRVLVAAGAAVVLGEAVALVDVHEVRVLLQVVGHVAVVAVVAHRGHDHGQDARQARIGFLLARVRARLFGRGLAGGLGQQLGHGFLHGVRGDGHAGDGVDGLLLNDLVGPGVAVVVGEQVVRALGGDGGLGDRAVLDGDLHVDGAEIGGLLDGVGAVVQRGGLGRRRGVTDVGFAGLGALGFSALGVGLSGLRLGGRLAQARLDEDVVGGLLDGGGGVDEGRAGDHVVLGGLVVHDGLGPLGADAVVQQIAVAGRGDRAIGDLLVLNGHLHLDGAEVVGALGGVGAGELIGHRAAFREAAGKDGRQDQGQSHDDQPDNGLLIHYYIIPSSCRSGRLFAPDADICRTLYQPIKRPAAG